MQQPLVSVLMTAFNREQYIAEAIESVLASTYSNFELIIVDDCSFDNTVNIAKKYAEKDGRVKVYINIKNLGDYPNRNMAASYATGKYLKYLDSDDKLLAFGLTYCVEQMEKFPQASLGMYSLNNLANETSVCIESENIVRDHFFLRQQLSIGPSGTIINRQKFVDKGGFDTRFGVASDMFFNISIASQSPVVLLPELFIFYRRHDGQEINNQISYLKFGYLYFKELMMHVKLPLKKKEISYLYRKMQKRHSLNLMKYFWRTKNLKSFLKIMRETNFSPANFLLSFLK